MKTGIAFTLLILTTACGTAPMDTQGEIPCKEKTGRRMYIYGDSISAGIPDGLPNYPERVACREGLDLVNRSIGGTKITDANQGPLILSDNWEDDAVIFFSPGVNDAILMGVDPVHLQTYRGTLQAVLDRVMTTGNVGYFGTPVSNCDPARFVSENVLLNYVNINMELITKATNQSSRIHFLDFHANVIPSMNSTVDCLHHNTEGSRRMANYVFSIIDMNGGL